MPVKISIEADDFGMVQALLAGMQRAIDGEFSDRGPLPAPVREPEPAPEAVLTEIGKVIEEVLDQASPGRSAVEPPPPAPRPKRRKLPAPALVEDVEPPPEVVHQEEEPEAEGAVEPPAPEPAPAVGVTLQQLRDRVNDLMTELGIPETKKRVAALGYTAVKDIPPEDWDRVYQALADE